MTVTLFLSEELSDDFPVLSFAHQETVDFVYDLSSLAEWSGKYNSEKN